MRAIIAAAGTGGHINPGIAIANKIKNEEPDSEIIFIGTERGLENDLVPRAGYKLKKIDAYGISRKLTFENISRTIKTIKSIGEAEKIIKEFKPDIVIGTGGYICLSTCMAAKKMKIPFVLHESNAFPGLAVKLLSKKAEAIMVGFEDAKSRLPKAKRVEVTGTPTKVRKKELTNEEKNKIKLELGLKENLKTVLAFGGSQGAKSINDTLINIIKENKNKSYQLIWSAGASQFDSIKDELENEGLKISYLKDVKIVPYIYNMEDVLNAVDLVVCRSGAMTITEISMVGKPAIFIPYPFATENHQEFNANVLVKVDAAKMILDKDITADKLNSMINSIVMRDEIIEEMGKKAKEKSILDVENKIYDVVKNIAYKNKE